MERLTEHDGNKYGFILCRDCRKPHCNECDVFCNQAATLAAFEEIGLTPAEIRTVQQMAHLHEDICRTLDKFNVPITFLGEALAELEVYKEKSL